MIDVESCETTPACHVVLYGLMGWCDMFWLHSAEGVSPSRDVKKLFKKEVRGLYREMRVFILKAQNGSDLAGKILQVFSS